MELPVTVFGLIWHGFNAVSCAKEPFRETVFFQIPLLLFLGKTAEGFFAAIADEERTGNDVHNLIGIFVPDGAVQGQTVDFPLVISYIMWCTT